MCEPYRPKAVARSDDNMMGLPGRAGGPLVYPGVPGHEPTLLTVCQRRHPYLAASDGCYETKEGQPAGWPSFVHGISIVAARPQRAVERLVDCVSERRFAVSRRQAIPPLLIALAVLEAPGLKARRVLEMQKLPVRQNLNVPHVVYLVFFVGAFDHGTVACGDVVDVAVLVVLIRGVVLGVVERRALLDVIRRHEFR